MDASGTTPLHSSLVFEQTALAKLLLENGAKLTAGAIEVVLDQTSQTPLDVVEMVKKRIRDIKWEITKWFWIGFYGESSEDCILKMLPKELVNEIVKIVEQDVCVT
jgi:hypothetical protein